MTHTNDTELTVPQPVVSPEPTPTPEYVEVSPIVPTPTVETHSPEPVPEKTIVAASIPSSGNATDSTEAASTTSVLSIILPLDQYTVSQGYSRGHLGIDMASELGTPIHAVAAGCLTISYGYNGGYGNMIEQTLNDGYFARYAHLSRFAASVSNGICVNQGDIIGYVGSTGRSTGPHLHFELQRYGAFIRPTFSN